MTDYQIIRESLPRTEILAQMAEECAELAQAALKLRRAITGENPTPVAMDAAEDAVCEEIADLIVCIEVAGDYLYDIAMHEEIREVHDRKLQRWARRIKAAQAG